MAIVVFTEHNQIFRIAKSEAQALCVFGNLNSYKETNKVITITDEQFNSLVLQTKEIDSFDGQNVVWRDVRTPPGRWSSTPEIVQKEIDSILLFIEKSLKYGNFNHDSNFKTEILAYQTVLKNLDVSSITYPMTGSLEKYISDNNLGKPISTLQLN